MRKLTSSGFIAPLSRREISSSAPKISSTAFERGIDVGDQAGVLAVALPLGQRRDVEARGVERLQDVVAGAGEEARLGDIGLLGVGLGASRARH